jgi:hypothetical protein
VAVARSPAYGLEAERVALVRVALEEVDPVDLALEAAVVLEQVQPIAQVDYVDQPVLDDGQP